jgi:two-component system, LytTR family, response regulator
MIRSIIIDDEESTIEEVKEIIESFKSIKVTFTASNPFKALEIIENNEIQVAFLDIDMPGMNGITLAEKISSIRPNMEIVFITAYNQYALEAFEVNAIDYILKPVRKERVEKSINKILKVINENLKEENKMVKIKTFNKFEVIINNIPIKWRTLKDKELFAYLIENINNPIHKEKIIEDLWQDIDIKNALIYLQSSIYRIRKILSSIGYNDCIKYANNCYTMNKINLDCDIWIYKKYLHISYEICESNISTYESISYLYKGDYLEEEGYIWAINTLENTRNKYLELLRRLGEYYISIENYNKAIGHLEKIIEVDPYFDSGVKLLFKLYYYKSDVHNLNKQFLKANKVAKEKYGLDLNKNLIDYYNKLKEKL